MILMKTGSLETKCVVEQPAGALNADTCPQLRDCKVAVKEPEPVGGALTPTKGASLTQAA